MSLLKDTQNRIEEATNALSTREMVKTRDYVGTDKSFYIKGACYVNTKKGKRIIIYNDSLFMFAPTSLCEILEKAIEETGCLNFNEILDGERVRFEKVTLKNGNSFYKTIIED